MPSHYAHYYFGKEVIRVMPGDAKDIINSNATSIDAYMIGLHGPDFLAFYRAWAGKAVRFTTLPGGISLNARPESSEGTHHPKRTVTCWDASLILFWTPHATLWYRNS